MNDRDLVCFLSLADTLNFTRSSEICNLSPSALSRAIARLEDELGTTLFVRDTRRTALSAEGSRFLPRARAILREWELAQNDYRSQGGELFGSLTIFATVTAAYSLLPPLLNPFRRSFPRVDVVLRTGDSANGIDAVLSGDVDLAVVPMTPYPVPRIGQEFLASTKLRFITSADHPLPLDWQVSPVILPERGLARQLVDDWFKRRFIHPRVHAQVSGNEGILAMVRLGFGIGLVPELVVQNSPFAQGIRFLPEIQGLGSFPIGLAYLETRKNLPILKAFISGQTNQTGEHKSL